MGFGDFQLNNNGKKEVLQNAKNGVRKEQVDKKFHNLFDTYDANKDGTLETNELNEIFNGLSSFAGDDKVLDTAENQLARSVFAEKMNLQNADFMGFVKSVSTASADIIETKEKQTPDGGKEVTTTYNDGTTETIAFYSNGDYKWKKTEKKFTETTYEMVYNGQKRQLNESEFKKVLAKIEEKKNAKTQKISLEGKSFKMPASESVNAFANTTEKVEKKEVYSPRYISEALGVNTETEDGKKVIERLSQLPQESLEKLKDGKELKELISSQELEPTFDNISNVLEITEGVTLRNEEEYKATEVQRQEILTQIKAANFMANLYETLAAYNDQYTDSVGLFGLGSEGIGYVLNKLDLDGENHYQWADSCREFAKNASELKVLNPQKFKEGFKKIYGENAKDWSIDYNSDAFKKCFALAESGKAFDKDNKMTDEYKEAILKAMNIVADDPNDSTLNQVMNGFGEALIMYIGLGLASGTKAGMALAKSTMTTFSKAGVAIASKQAKNKLVQGALRFTGQAVKLVGPALNEGSKMYLYTAAEGTVMNVSNRTIKLDGFDKLLDTQAQVKTNAEGSFTFGAFAGVFGSTITQKVMQRVSKVASKVTTALSERFSQGAVSANEVFATIMEKSAPTKIAEAAAFATDVVGFTAFESALYIANTLQREGTLTSEKLVDTLMEEFGHQGYSLGQIKVISHLIMMLTGSRSARMQSQKYLQENLTQLKGATVEWVNGSKDGFKINLPDGRRIECKNSAEMISSLQLMVRGETVFSSKFEKLNEAKAERSKSDNAPQPNPLPQGAREQGSVHIDKNADGTFNVKDGDYYWHVKNNEELSFVTDYLSQRKDLSGMLIKEKVRDDGSKLIKEVDPQTGKSVRTTKVNSDGSIEYITFYEHKNGVTTKSVELYSDKAFVTDYRISDGKYQESKETEIYSNGQKDVTVYDSYGKVEEKYSIPNVELVVNKDGSYVSEENIDILMQKFGITDRNEAAMLLENVIDCGVNDRFLRILTNLNDTNKKIILPLVKNNKTAYIAYNVMENVNATNKHVLEFATKNLNIDELQLFDLSRLVDEVNASRILNALKEGKDLRVLSNRYHNLKCIYDPIMQKMDSTNKIEFIQKEIDSFEQDLSKITNEPLKYTDLFELKLQNKERYERILNSGLIKALENGTVKNVKIPRLANADLSPEIYSDLKLLKEGKSIIKEFSADTDIKEAYKATSIGDVVEVGKQMYINDGKKLSKWNMTKEMFLKLFPPVDRFAFKQKKLGDCYLLSSISSVMRNKKASVTFYQSFEYDGKDVKVTVKAYEDYNGSQTFTNGELSNLGKKQVEGCRGVQLYERTYAKVALREQDIIYPNTAESKALMQRIEGGNSSQAIQEILGTKAINYDDAKSDMMIEKSISIPYKRNSASTVNVELEQFNSKGIQDILNNFKENQPNTSIALYLGNSKNIKTVIDYLANNDNIILNFGTKHDLKLTDILKKQHAYSVCGYNKSTGIVKVVDPHNNSNIKEIHIDELSKLTNTIYITNLAK